MKRKIGKILLLVVLLLTMAVLHTPAFATPVGDVRVRVGAFTGPINGTAQDDNIKASLDIMHTLIGPQLTKGTGEIIYCDSGATGGGTGASWTHAAVTLDAAVGLCTADRGDWILVASGHAETITAADGVDCDKAGITILGLGNGENRPTFTMNHANAEFVIGADDVSIYNLEFIAHITAVAHCIDVETTFENFVIENCRFTVDVDGTDEFVDCITVAATGTNGGLIKGNTFRSGLKSNAGPQSWINFIDCNDLHIIGNSFTGDCAVACIQNETTAANNVLIKDNVLFNGIIGGEAGLNTEPCIELVATTTGMIVNNNLFCNVATPNLAIVGADMFLAGNTYGETEGASGGSMAIGTTGDAGLKCAYVQPTSIATVTNLFQVTGGPIIIRDIVGVVTSNMAATTCLINYNIDPVAPATDTVFGTDGLALEIDGDAAGTVYTWDGVIAADLTATTNGVLLTQGTDVSNGILCPIGMIELAATATNAGVVAFYMVYSPLSPLSVVTPQ